MQMLTESYWTELTLLRILSEKAQSRLNTVQDTQEDTGCKPLHCPRGSMELTKDQLVPYQFEEAQWWSRLEQCCPTELSMMKEALYISADSYNSHEPHMAIEHLKCVITETEELNF